MQLVATLDEYGKPAWFAATILGFIVWWPIGLGVLAYLIWSGRMGCGNRNSWRSYFKEEAQRFQSGFGSTGNRAFDAYREETLKRSGEGRGVVAVIALKLLGEHVGAGHRQVRSLSGQ
ncbi:MAG: DUF2852 domain-containing protein [Methyloceanibacter sp.]